MISTSIKSKGEAWSLVFRGMAVSDTLRYLLTKTDTYQDVIPKYDHSAQSTQSSRPSTAHLVLIAETLWAISSHLTIAMHLSKLQLENYRYFASLAH